MNRKTGMWVMMAAISVTGPRYVLTFLQADGIEVWPWAETFILAVTGIGTGLVLTGGGMYIAHKLATKGNGFWSWLFLALSWLSLLIFSIGLIAPALVFALQKSQFSAILVEPYNWYWAVMAVVSVEVLAGAAMVAQAGENENQPQENKSGNFSILADALTNRLAFEIAGQQNQPTGTSGNSRPEHLETADNPAETSRPEMENQPTKTVETSRPKPPKPAKRKHNRPNKREAMKQRRMAELVQFLAENAGASDQQMADAIGSAKATAQNYRDELLADGIIHRNGHGYEVKTQ